MRVLALDFDGVISDSAPEAFAVALRTYAALCPDAELAGAAARLGADEALSAERLCATPLYRDFLQAMPLGNRAEDYGVLLRALERRAPLPDQEAYDAFRSGCEQAFLARFHERFYQERERLALQAPERWRSLLGPYPELVALLRRRAGDAVLAVATAKDGASVARLLRDYGIADLFAPGAVLDKEAGVEKRAHLQELARRLAAPLSWITFVDDKVNHLEKTADLGVRGVLAGWGYNGERERERARRRGFEVADLEDAERILFDAAPAATARL